MDISERRYTVFVSEYELRHCAEHIVDVYIETSLHYRVLQNAIVTAGFVPAAITIKADRSANALLVLTPSEWEERGADLRAIIESAETLQAEARAQAQSGN